MDRLALSGSFDSFANTRSKGRTRNKRTSPAPSRPTAPQTVSTAKFSPLIAEDWLYFRYAIRTDCSERTPVHAGIAGPQAAHVTVTFLKAFQKVWKRIPPADRQLILNYWRYDLSVERLFYTQPPAASSRATP